MKKETGHPVDGSGALAHTNAELQCGRGTGALSKALLAEQLHPVAEKGDEPLFFRRTTMTGAVRNCA